MSKRLQEDVLFVNIDGMYDLYTSTYPNPHGVKANDRYKIVKDVKKFLTEKGCRVKLLNPRRDADIRIQPFPFFIAPQNTEYNKELDYSIFLLKKLYDYIKHEEFTHIIVFQYDGHINDFSYWDDVFLEYDFMGSTNGNNSEFDIENFFSLKDDRRGMHFNGGFSLRSRELVKKCSEIPLSEITNLYNKFSCNNEDLLILDYVDWAKIPLDPKIINKFVNIQGATKSFGFHKI